MSQELASSPWVRSHPDELWCGLVSISDRASRGVYADQGLPALQQWLQKALQTPVRFETRLIPDEQGVIEDTLRDLVDACGCDLVLTTGGTGPARRDVTPEATLAVATRELPGFGERMRQISLRFVPTAILSRQVGVIRDRAPGLGSALIVNLPGQPKAIAETLEGLRDPESGVWVEPGLFSAIPYAVQLLDGPYIDTDPEVCPAFRPKAARRGLSDHAN